ncbi:protein LIKE COV 1-like [Senna tora]|uniref:Protein LIKE COV 1-like n=1 Tax=Senna tora TaxID=362788 RepID=A0A835CBC8_9FABA|nr:protein LIKE COV 1-like [Senna tora]
MGDDQSSTIMANRDRDRELLIPVADSPHDDAVSKPSSSSSSSSSHHAGRETFYKVVRSWASKKFMTGCSDHPKYAEIVVFSWVKSLFRCKNSSAKVFGNEYAKLRKESLERQFGLALGTYSSKSFSTIYRCLFMFVFSTFEVLYLKNSKLITFEGSLIRVREKMTSFTRVCGGSDKSGSKCPKIQE